MSLISADRRTGAPAAVELLNVLRPTVAVAAYVTFVAHALHRHPDARRRLVAGEPGYAHLYVQEVRRLYPFFPAVMANVRHDFEWRSYRFAQGRKPVPDLFGTDRDMRTWKAPGEFRPDRFRDWGGSPFSSIPSVAAITARTIAAPANGSRSSL